MDDARRLRRCQRVRRQTELRSRAPERLPRRIGLDCREQEQPLRRLRKRLDHREERRAQPRSNREVRGQPRRAADLVGPQLRGELEKRKRIAVRLRKHASVHCAVDRHGERRGQQLRRGRAAKAADDRVRDAVKGRSLRRRRVGGNNRRNAVLSEPSTRKRERLERGRIQPVTVVDQKHQRLRACCLRQQRVSGESRRKLVMARNGRRRNGRRRIVKQHCKSLQSGERQVHLRSHTRQADDAAPESGRSRGVIEQRRKADARRAAENEGAAATRPGRRE